jgi:RNA polymerase sigma-70 factor (ECF subfamily)
MDMQQAVRMRRSVLAEFEDLYRSEFAQVFRAVFMVTGDRELAGDITQEAFKRAYASWRRISGRAWTGGWVMTTALNLAKKRSREIPSDPAPAGATNGEFGTRVDVVAALRRLPRRQRHVVVMYYIGDFPIGVIAELLEMREGTVKAHLAQGRAALREMLEVRHA